MHLKLQLSLLLLYLFYCYIGSYTISGATDLNHEASILLSIKSSLVDPLDKLHDWKLPTSKNDSNHCSWTGVYCNELRFVEKLDLSRMNLSGKVSDEFHQLSSLSFLNLCCNEFTTVLPNSLTNVTSLSFLDVSQNLFSGTFPLGFGKFDSLSYLNASCNNFEGDLPRDLSNATLLETLDLRGSYFVGSIPASYMNLQKLKFLGLSGNNLTGQIPPQLGHLSSLETMILGYNMFEGEIPREFGNLTNLKYLDLTVANLGGEIPSELGGLVQLDTLYLYKNSLVGKIPPKIGNLSSLVFLDFSDNFLSGEIPAEIGELKNLQLINLMFNELTGSVPYGIGKLPQLQILELWNNSLSGHLPSDLGKNSPLQWLDISSNSFSGEIPSGLCDKGNLTKLILFNNAFDGSTPTSLSKCESLVRVRVQNNRLSGTIPLGLGKLPNLQRLELANNSLTGSIPNDLASSLSLSFIDFSGNLLQSTLPSTILSLPNLQTLRVSNNNLGGRIPDQFQDCPSLSVLDLSSNHFTGMIPTSIASCQKLVTLSLKNNQLTGEIPDSIAMMPSLAILDLSNNTLTGKIPEHFGSSPALEMFNVSHNQLVGPIPPNGILKTINPADLAGNEGLCGGILPPCSAASLYGTDNQNLRTRRVLIGWAIGVSAVLAVGIAFLGVNIIYRKWYSNGTCFERHDDGSNGAWPWRLMAFQKLGFTSNDILSCIKESNVIGMGASGIVYKAEITRLNLIVAVKKLWKAKTDIEAGNSGDDLVGEVNLLGKLRHRNIVRLLGFLHNDKEAMILYEYMHNGNLGDALHKKQAGELLVDWVSRYNIAVGVAHGLAYLHHDCHPPVIHRDVKSNNILLDANLDARIADFGLAKMMIKNNETVSMIAGSHGYIAPEYGYSLKVDEKSDIYSYGVVLLELLTGKRPTDKEFGESTDVVEWIRNKARNNRSLEQVLNPCLAGNCKHVQEEMLLVLRIAILCTAKVPRDRPSMRDGHHHHHEFSPRWEFSSSDFRRPPGNGKHGGWHMYPEDPGYSTPRSDRFMDDDMFRSSGMRGDGRYGRFYRENRPSFGQKDWRGHSWEPNHHHSGPANAVGRPNIVNDQRTIVESPMHASHPHSDPRDQSHSKEQIDKTSDANGSGMGQKVDKESILGSLDWKPLKWSRSGSLTSRGSGFSHSSSSKSMGGESSGDVKGDLPPKSVTPMQSPSGDTVVCIPSVAPPEEAFSRKKPRLGWGEGLAKYEKKKVDPEDNVNKSGNVNSVSNVEPSYSLPSNLVEKSPKITGFSDCSSPATPSSFACSSSPGMEDRTYGKTVDAVGDASNFSVSSMLVSGSQLEGSHFRLEKLELKSITNLGFLLNELLLADDQCSMDSGFMRSSAINKLLLWKGEISKTLELTETEIDMLENELSLLKSDTVQSFHCPASSNSGPADYKDGQSDGKTVLPKPKPLEVVSNGDLILEDRHLCDDAQGVQAESKDRDIDSPGTATSKFVGPPIQKAVSLDICKKPSYGETGFVESTKSTTDVGSSCQGHDRSMGQVNNSVAFGIEHPGVCDNKEDNICGPILSSNKEFANRAAEGLLKLLPSCNYSIEANKVSCMPVDSTIKEKFLRRRRSLRFKERVIALKYRAFHHLWKEDLRLLSLRSHQAKPLKKLDPSSRAMQIWSQKNRSSIRSRFTSPVGSVSLVPTTEIINFTGKLLSDSQPKLYRSGLKMPAMILDEKEKMSRFMSSNGLVENPCAVEKERSFVNPWTCKEKEIFMDKLAFYGKDFRKIAAFIDHKTIADCIEFYYKNHKSESFEKIKKLEVKKQGKPLSSNTYMVTSGKKWSSREINAASLDILAAQADQALETSRLLSGKLSNRKSRGSDSIVEASCSFYGAEDERETAAADVLAGICGSLSSEAMSSCITSSVDPGEGNQDCKHQKAGPFIRRPLIPEVTQNVDDDTCSDESCGEMDPADWTDDEKSLFVQAFSSHGKDFLTISRCVRTKSRDQCKVFFSKAKKCLGLDALPTGSGSGGIHARNDTNGGGRDTKDAGIMETISVVCSDKSGSRIDEDLLHVNQDVSKPEAIVAELNILEENCGPGQLDHKDSGVEWEDLLPHGQLADVSDSVACGGVVDVVVQDSATAIDTQRSDVHPMIKDANVKMNARVCTSDSKIAPVDSGVAMDMEAACGISDRISEVHVSSIPVKFASPGDGLCKPSTNRDNVHHLQPGSSMMNQGEFQNKKGFPLDLSIKADLHDVVTHTVGAESIADRSFQQSFLRKCSRNVTHNSVAELPLLNQSEVELGSSCSSKTEKPCRNGNVKLFGKILSKPSSADKPSNVVHDEKAKHHYSPAGKFDMKLAANQDLKGNSTCFADDHTSFLGLENVPIRSYGFWDGTKIHTGFSTLPDSALLLAKFPGAFSNYSISSPKSEQQPLQAPAVNGNEFNVNGTCVFSPREFSSSNGGNVMDYTVIRGQEGLQPFRLDMKQTPKEVVFPEVQRNGIETLQSQGKGVVKLNVVQGGDILGGSCTGISDPVAALKLHYANQQFGGGGGHGHVNGIVREEPCWSQGGDLGR